MDGLSPGTWLGKERPMPWTVEENNFPKHTLYLYSSKNPYFYEYHFVINVGRRNEPSLRGLQTGRYQNSPNWQFWPLWAKPFWLIWCPVDGLVGGCGARAVCRKTTTYFIFLDTL